MLLVPFHIPHDPSAAQMEDMAARIAEGDFKSSACGEDRDFDGGG